MAHKFSIRTRLLVLSAVAVLGLGSMGGFALYEFARMNARSEAALAVSRSLARSVDLARTAQVRFKKQVQEWKNILLRGKDRAQYQKYLDGFNREEQSVQEDLKNLAVELKTIPGGQAISVKAVADTLKDLGPKYRAALTHYDPSAADPASIVDKAVKGIDRAPTDAIDGLVHEMQRLADKVGAQQVADTEALTSEIHTAMASFALVFSIVVVALSLLIIRSVALALAQGVSAAQNIAKGVLTNRIDGGSCGEIGALMTALDTMQASLRGLIAQARTNSEQLGVASRQLATAAQGVAGRSQDQSEAASSMAASVEQMTVSVNHVADASSEALKIAEASSRQCDDGDRVTHATGNKVRIITESIDASSQVVQALLGHADKISSIVNVIKDVSDQTNLLALNAAIEAARAGEQGRGFAVVADEVRKLAERTKLSTQEITALISNLQESTRAVFRSMETSVESAKEGLKLSDDASTAITRINTSAQTVVGVVTEMSSSLKEQASATDSIAQKVEQIAQMAEENSAAVSQVRSAAKHLDQLASSLHGTVSRFAV